MSPRSTASFRILCDKYPEKRLGKSVSTSKRIALPRPRSALLLARGRRRSALGFEPGHELVQKDRDLFGGLRPDALPVLDPLRVQRDGLVTIAAVRVVGA